MKRSIVVGLVGGALALAFVAALTRWYLFYEPELPVAAASGQQYFHERDLGSPYQTGIPYALVMAAMEKFPEHLGKDQDEFCAKFGVLLDPKKADRLPIGFVLHYDRLSGTEFIMTNCSLCHTAAVNGQLVAGLGNKTLRLNAVNHAIMDLVKDERFTAETMVPAAESAARRFQRPWSRRSKLAIREAITKLKELSKSEETDTWGGVSGIDAGPGRNTPIEFGKASSHVAVGPPYGFAKIPAVWTFPKRSTFGWDGSLKGDMPLALAAVEFNKRMPPEEILRRQKQWQSLYAYLKTLKAPLFPGVIDQKLAAAGRETFTQNCSDCHGTYSQQGADYQEQVIALSDIGTDPDRYRSVTPELVKAREQGPFAKFVTMEITTGYIPPPLDGVWCRGPYLHNASVPTLEDLLRLPAQRPVKFWIGGDTAYDTQRIGLQYEEEILSSGERAGRRTSPGQSEFDVRAPGNGNGGHEFGVDLSPDEKRALLEYLKTL